MSTAVRAWSMEARRAPVVLRPGNNGLVLWVGSAG